MSDVGEVKSFPAFGKKPHRTTRAAKEDEQTAQELLAIANRLEQLAGQTPWPKWIGALAGEVRRAAKACVEG